MTHGFHTAGGAVVSDASWPRQGGVGPVLAQASHQDVAGPRGEQWVIAAHAGVPVMERALLLSVDPGLGLLAAPNMEVEDKHDRGAGTVKRVRSLGHSRSPSNGSRTVMPLNFL